MSTMKPTQTVCVVRAIQHVPVGATKATRRWTVSRKVGRAAARPIVFPGVGRLHLKDRRMAQSIVDQLNHPRPARVIVRPSTEEATA